jgi:hypothetical protein
MKTNRCFTFLGTTSALLNLVHFENWSFPRKYIIVNLGV